MRLRATLEENYVSRTPDLLVTGTFDDFDGAEVTELPNLPDMTELKLRWTAAPSACWRAKRKNTWERRHMLGFCMEVGALNGDAALFVESGINGQVTNMGAQHFHEGSKRLYDLRILRVISETLRSGVTRCQFAANRYWVDGKRELRFPLHWRGQAFHVTVRQDGVKLETRSGKSVQPEACGIEAVLRC